MAISSEQIKVCLKELGLIFFLLLCRLGDQIVSVNGISLLNVTHAEAVQTLKDSGSTIELVYG